MTETKARLDSTESTSPRHSRSLSLLEPPDPSSPAPTFRHSGWAERRVAIHAALRDSAASPRRTARFATCGSQAWVLKSTTEPDTYRLVPDFCHDRWCVPCALARGHRIAENILAHFHNAPARFLTLTLAADRQPLQPRINRLLHAFQRLRRTSLWHQRVDGGCAFLEITRGRANDHWHPHIHALLDGRFIPKELLAREWQRITGDSYILDIQLVRDPRLTARYVTKYASKPLDSKLHREPSLLVEAIDAMRNRKLLYTFGTWTKLALLAPPPSTGWRLYAHLNDLLFREHTGDQTAHAILTAILYIPDVAAGCEFGIGPAPPDDADHPL